jgi:hypothetical protein
MPVNFGRAYQLCACRSALLAPRPVSLKAARAGQLDAHRSALRVPRRSALRVRSALCNLLSFACFGLLSALLRSAFFQNIFFFIFFNFLTFFNVDFHIQQSTAFVF